MTPDEIRKFVYDVMSSIVNQNAIILQQSSAILNALPNPNLPGAAPAQPAKPNSGDQALDVEADDDSGHGPN